MRDTMTKMFFCLGAIALGSCAGSSAATSTAPERASPDESELLLDEATDFDALPRDLSSIGDPTPWLLAGFRSCGSIALHDLDGQWVARDTGAVTQIERGRILSGSVPRSEHCLAHVVERSDTRIVAVAVWHRDVDDPGDATLTHVQLTRRGAALEICTGDDLDHLTLPEGCVELQRAN